MELRSGVFATLDYKGVGVHSQLEKESTDL